MPTITPELLHYLNWNTISKGYQRTFCVAEHLERLQATANKNNTVRSELPQHCCWRF